MREFRRISEWGARQIWKTRFAIGIGSILLALLSMSVGALLAGAFPLTSAPWMIAGIIVFVTTVLLYPTVKHPYHLRKLADTGLLFAGMLLFAGHGITVSETLPATPSVIPVVHTVDANAANKSARSIWKSLDKTERKAWRKAIRNELKELRKQGAGKNKGLLIFLTVIGAIALWMLLVALSCSIACSGAEGVAWLVFFGGTAGIIVLSVFLIRRIVHGKPSPEPGE